jgi:hypothetical protein
MLAPGKMRRVLPWGAALRALRSRPGSRHPPAEPGAAVIAGGTSVYFPPSPTGPTPGCSRSRAVFFWRAIDGRELVT